MPDAGDNSGRRLIGNCPDCQVAPGEAHEGNCDVARCPECGHQRLCCPCDSPLDSVWTGEWPGVAECREYGFYARLVPGRGWVTCERDHPEATEDLTRLSMVGTWDKAKQRYTVRNDGH